MKFNIKKDKQYPEFCQACLIGKAEAEMNKRDTRYCLECQPVIEYEYSLLADKSHSKRYEPVKPEANFKAIESPSVEKGTGEGKTKMSTSNENNATVDNFRPTGRLKTYKKRELPEELIMQLHSDGMGSKAIATRLKDRGIDVSYKTIQRVLAGQR